MKDFLTDFDPDEAKKNPFKAFAVYTALKFQTIDKVCDEIQKRSETNEKEIISIKDNKLNKDDFNKFIRDYDTLKAKLGVYVAVGSIFITLVVNLVIWYITNNAPN